MDCQQITGDGSSIANLHSIQCDAGVVEFPCMDNDARRGRVNGDIDRDDGSKLQRRRFVEDGIVRIRKR